MTRQKCREWRVGPERLPFFIDVPCDKTGRAFGKKMILPFPAIDECVCNGYPDSSVCFRANNKARIFLSENKSTEIIGMSRGRKGVTGVIAPPQRCFFFLLCEALIFLIH